MKTFANMFGGCLGGATAILFLIVYWYAYAAEWTEFVARELERFNQGR